MTHAERTTLGRRFREARKRQGLSRRTLAERSGISERQIAAIEYAEVPEGPRLSTVLRLAAALELSLDSLVGPATYPY